MCKCGGILDIVELTRNRWRYKCLSCKRYEIMLPHSQRKTLVKPKEPR